MIVHEWRTDETDATARGRAFGAAWSTQLAASFEEYQRLFDDFGIRQDQSRRVADESLELTARWAPEVASELEGMAQGSGLEPWQVMVLNARTEVMTMLTLATEGECSTTVHLPADGSAPRTMQTWDWHDTLSNETVVRAYETSGGIRVATFAEFGQAAKIGVNSHGLGIHFNILHHRSDGTQPGVPVHIVARRILDEATTVEDAKAIVDEVPIGASTVITVATAGGAEDAPAAACIEMSPEGWAAIEAQRGGTLTHTNHFLDPELAAGEVSAYPSTTGQRLQFLNEHPELTAIPDSVERAMAYGAVPGAAICVRPRTDMPRHLTWETKLTATLDLAEGALGFHTGSPADVRSESWRTFAA